MVSGPTGFVAGALILLLLNGKRLLAQLMRRRPRTGDSWLLAAQRLGLACRQDARSPPGRISGKREGVNVSAAVAWPTSVGRTGELTRVIAHVPRRRGRFSLTRQDEHALPAPGDPVLTGDEALDGAARISGNDAAALAGLNDRARRALTPMLARWPAGTRLQVGGGQLWLERARRVEDAGDIERMILDAVELARSMQAEGSRPLVARMRDPDPGVRARVLELLDVQGVSTDVAAAGAIALDDADSRVRMAGARLLVERGARAESSARAADVLAAIAVDVEADGEARAEAFEALRESLPDRAAAVTRALLGAADFLLHEALEATSQIPVREALPLLEELAAGARELPASTCAELGRALAALGGPASEPAMVATLVAAGDEAPVALIDALGAVGSIAAVEPLMTMAARRLATSERRAAARAAIDAIQQRSGVVEEGRLSLHSGSDHEGRLSAPPDGALSPIPRDPP